MAAGEKDPWELLEEGRKLASASSVEEFISFPGEQTVRQCTSLATACAHVEAGVKARVLAAH